MGSYKETFEWFDFPQGRIRYTGTQRGREEPPISTFAIEIDGWIYYGEIGNVFWPSGNNYNLEIVSFGWAKPSWVGTEPNPAYCSAFTSEELDEVQSLICHAVPAWRELEARPSILTEFDNSHFMGEIIFRDGWALVRDGDKHDQVREELMTRYTGLFEWIDFSQGRVRYAGGMRGRDDPSIETFAISIFGHVYYGEIGRLFSCDRNNYSLGVISFGWLARDWFGVESDSRYCASFTSHDLDAVQALLCQAVSVWINYEERPPFLTEFAKAHFMGDIIFRDGWALVGDEDGL